MRVTMKGKPSVSPRSRVRLMLRILSALAICCGMVATAAVAATADITGARLELPLSKGFCALSVDERADRAAIDSVAAMWARNKLQPLVTGTQCTSLTALRQGSAPRDVE